MTRPPRPPFAQRLLATMQEGLRRLRVDNPEIYVKPERLTQAEFDAKYPKSERLSPPMYHQLSTPQLILFRGLYEDSARVHIAAGATNSIGTVIEHLDAINAELARRRAAQPTDQDAGEAHD